MINYAPQLVSALTPILPTYYELALTNDIMLPCISYQERNNYMDATGDTLGYTRISYTIKIWATAYGTVQVYAPRVDAAMRKLGFKRVSSGELFDKQSTRVQKILTYEAYAFEHY